MSNGRFKKGQSGNPGGMSAEQKAERARVTALLLCPDNDSIWLQAYRVELAAGTVPVLLDYANRRLGKVAEQSDDASQQPTKAHRRLSPAELREHNEAIRLAGDGEPH